VNKNVAIALSLILLSGCWPGPLPWPKANSCDFYQRIASDKEVIDALIGWTDSTFMRLNPNSRVSNDRGSIRQPGQYLAQVSPDLEQYGFPEQSETRVINSDRGVVAIFFGHRTMHGIIISVSPEKGVFDRFGVVTDHLHPVSERVAYVCYQRD
jgi:hypothetical protein